MRVLQNRNVDYNFIFSGQHQSTITDIREEFGVKEPDVILYKGPDITGVFQMLYWFFKTSFFVFRNRDKVWKSDKNGIVLNHGDTFSTLLGSILAKIYGLKSAHVESGLRSFNLFNPFPEELTRRVVFRLTDIFFVPGDWAMKNVAEFRGVKIDTHCNTLIDSLEASKLKVEEQTVDVPEYQYGVVSVHRFENIFSKEKFRCIVSLVESISKHRKLLFILHKPTEKKLIEYSFHDRLKINQNIELRPRYSYFKFIKLVKNASFVVTDGGSNQEECFYLGKPCLILRKATERDEGLGKNALLSQYDSSKIENFIRNIDSFKQEPIEMSVSPSSIIVDYIKKFK